MSKIENETVKKFTDLGDSELIPFTPTIIGDDIPSLRITPNRYLHWFRGYYFQLSGTHNGSCCYNTSCFSMEELMSLCKGHLGDESPDSFNFVFVMSALTTLLKSYYCMQNWLQTSEGKRMFNKFLSLSAEQEYYVSSCVCLDDLLQYVTVTKTNQKPVITATDKACTLSVNDLQYAVVVDATKYLIVVTQTDCSEWTVTTLQYPKWLAVNEDFTQNSRKLFNRAMLEFILVYSGISADRMQMCPDVNTLSYFEQMLYKLKDDFKDFDDLVKWFTK